jgi:hypothetical protein
MGREVRRVPETWQHPKDGRRFIPLYRDKEGRPQLRADQCMPAWPEAERTHFQMYETTTAGTPISPPCRSAKELAHWLSETHADAGAGQTATEKEWLAMIERGQPVPPFELDKGVARPAFVKPA